MEKAVETSEKNQKIESHTNPDRLRYEVLRMQTKKVFEEVAHKHQSNGTHVDAN